MLSKVILEQAMLVSNSQSPNFIEAFVFPKILKIEHLSQERYQKSNFTFSHTTRTLSFFVEQ